MAVEAVVYDIGNVLIEWNPERFYDAEIGETRRKDLFANVPLHAMNDRVDMGHDFKGSVHALADDYPAYRTEILMWHDRWIDMASPAIDQSVQLLRALRANGVPVFALSNFGIGSFEIAQGVYDFLHEFDRPYISGHMGVIKPDPEIYRRLEEDSGVAPAALLFADDRADNIAMAASRGWQTHHFTGPQGWAERLISEGLVREDQAA